MKPGSAARAEGSQAAEGQSRQAQAPQRARADHPANLSHTGYAADLWWETAPELHLQNLLTRIDVPALAAATSPVPSHKQRGPLLPSPSEFSLHVTIADVLRRWALPGVEWTHFPAGELRTAATAGKLARMGTRRGWADFQIFHADGRVSFSK